ncbi:hypothetical protein [Ferruginivarius sediminum]|uniref:Uncharacterized protein n=1 Tax=Ferruginivarius sediminum TaxID=2661937 RepID=A0A369TDK0_9PROT|nr:hypothetical protein [Ferruginivarius sediminum]RDD62604.1 hypothetical protein DRB17_05430 [Ferruginivarius sediminum]
MATQRDDNAEGGRKAGAPADDRQARQARALRENLRKRKAQKRGRKSRADADGTGCADTGDSDTGGQ